jgi:ribosomal RNA-processing protein 9
LHLQQLSTDKQKISGYKRVTLMPDSFFSSKPRKRKRADTGAKAGPSGVGKFTRKGSGSDTKKNGAAIINGTTKKRKIRAEDEELSDESDEGPGGIDDMDLRGDADDDAGVSGEEDEDETPAEKRLRLAKLYLESVKEGLGELFRLPHWSN